MKKGLLKRIALSGMTLVALFVMMIYAFPMDVYADTSFYLEKGPDPLVRVPINEGENVVYLESRDDFCIYNSDEDGWGGFESSIDVPYAGGESTFGSGGRNFEVSQSGYYVITLTDKGDGTWFVSVLYSLDQTCTVSDIPDQTYTGSAIEPEVTVTMGENTLTLGTDYEVTYSNNTNVGTASVTVTGIGNYSGTITKTFAINKELSGSESYTAQDGDVLTGSTSGTVTIANNAKITLSDVTITGGIVCEGSAEITLIGTNSVTGAENKAGIQVGGSGTTLTIKGDGSLTANGANYAAGIGLNGAFNVTEDVIGGNIVIESGIIAANGGEGAAGIGAGFTKDQSNSSERKAIVGNIIIKGGTVTAVGVTAVGGNGADGIGAGDNIYDATYQIGTVTIYDDIDKVDASSISESVTYMHDETDVTANASNYFTITEDGNRRIIAPKDDTDYTITIANGIEHGSLTGAATAKYMETVTITATPDFGYRLSRLVVKDAENNNVATTGNTFLMPKGNVTVSAVFEQGTHGTTEFEWGYFGSSGFVTEASIYDGVTTVELQQWQSYQILKYDEDSYREFLLDNNTYRATIPYSGGTGTFPRFESTKFYYSGESGFYDITMTDVGNGKWSVSILKTVGVIGNIPDQTYTGSEITPEPLVLAGSLSLTKGTDYEYSYTNNINIGTAKVTVTFKGDYASLGSVEKEFNITQTNSSAPTFSGHGLLLTGQIGVEFLITLPEGIDAQDTYMTFARNHMDSNYQATAQATGDGRYQYIVFIPAYQMADQITPTLHYMDGSEEKTVVGEAYSAEEYITWGLADNHLTGDALNVVRALADYGYYSQFYLSRVNGWTRGTDYAAMTTKYSEEFDYDTTYSALASYDVSSDIAGLSYRLNFGSTTRLDIRFTTVEGQTVKLDGATVTPTVSDGYSTVSISGIQASQLTTGHQLQVGDKTVTISPMSYARTLLGREGEADDLKKLLCAFYNYGNACAEYGSNQ